MCLWQVLCGVGCAVQLWAVGRRGREENPPRAAATEERVPCGRAAVPGVQLVRRLELGAGRKESPARAVRWRRPPLRIVACVCVRSPGWGRALEPRDGGRAALTRKLEDR